MKLMITGVDINTDPHSRHDLTVRGLIQAAEPKYGAAQASFEIKFSNGQLFKIVQGFLSGELQGVVEKTLEANPDA